MRVAIIIGTTLASAFLANRADAGCPNGTQAKGAGPPNGFETWCEDAQGDRQGPYVQWRKDGTKLVQGSMKDDERDGLWLQWGEDGTILGMAYTFVRGTKAGYFASLYPDGNMPDLEGEEPDGVWIWYTEGGRVKDAEYREKGKRRDATDAEVVAAFERYKANREDLSRQLAKSQESNKPDSMKDSDPTAKKTAYKELLAKVMKNKKGAPLVKKAESQVKAVCTLVASRMTLTQKIERECPTKTEQVGDVTVGGSDRACPMKKLVELGRQDSALKVKVETAKKKLQPIADGAGRVGPDFQRDYSAFLQAAFGCYCPNESTGAAGPCR